MHTICQLKLVLVSIQNPNKYKQQGWGSHAIMNSHQSPLGKMMTSSTKDRFHAGICPIQDNFWRKAPRLWTNEDTLHNPHLIRPERSASCLKFLIAAIRGWEHNTP
jgi:hypothetical protein